MCRHKLYSDYGLQRLCFTLYRDVLRCRRIRWFGGSMSASKDAKTQILWGRKFGLERRR